METKKIDGKTAKIMADEINDRIVFMATMLVKYGEDWRSDLERAVAARESWVLGGVSLIDAFTSVFGGTE